MVLHHSGLVPSHHERPGMLQWISINYEGVALMEEHSIVSLSNVISLQVLLDIAAYHLCLHTLIALLCQKSNTDRTFV